MRTKKTAGFLALVLCVVFIFTACGTKLPGTDGGTSGSTGNSTRDTIPYSEMAYERPDVAGMKTRMAEVTADVQNAGSIDDILTVEKEVDALYSNFYTMRTLAMLKKYHDVNDTYFEEEYRTLDEASVELSNLVNDYNRAIVEGTHADAYRDKVGAYVYQSIVDGLRLNSSAVEAYKKERNQLNTDYNKMLTTATVTYDGVEYTMADINALGGMDYYMLLSEYYSQNAPAFGELYVKMIELDKQTASTLGFDSPAEMYYLGYTRDYSPADALQLCTESKRLFVPLLEDVYGTSYNAGQVQMQAAMNQMPAALAEVDAELAEAWSFMTEYGLYDLAPSAGKQDGVGFTTELYGWDAPFIFFYWTDDFASTTTLMHEFGHFYDDWLRYDTTVVGNLDIAETYSQGLELLMHKQYGDFTMYGEEATMASLQDFMNVLTYQSLLEEFQQTIYSMDNLDYIAIGQVYGQLLEDYGFGSYFADDNGSDGSWFQVTHLFDAPFYTISYVTSAVSALQIWAESQQDWDAAVDTYMKLIRADQNQPFTDLLASAGLKAPHETAVLEEIAGYFVDVFGPQG